MKKQKKQKSAYSKVWMGLARYLVPALKSVGTTLNVLESVDVDKVNFPETETLCLPPNLQITLEPDLMRGRHVWYLQEVVRLPGVYTLRNGDPGFPDDEEIREISHYTMKEAHHLARRAAEEVAKRLIDDAVTCASEDEQAEMFEGKRAS